MRKILVPCMLIVALVCQLPEQTGQMILAVSTPTVYFLSTPDSAATEKGLDIPSLSTSAPIELTTTKVEVNVKRIGAKGDGNSDDGPYFQQALDYVAVEGGGKVYIPAGTFFIDRTLIVGDNTEIFGEGRSSVLMRGNSRSAAPLYAGLVNCEKNAGSRGRVLFVNSKYNCGNTGIYMHDFSIDGSLVTEVPNAVTIAFSAIADTHIRNLYIKNVPQDAIFLRNGGVRVSVTNTTIDGFNMLWYNGAGINIEMYGNGNLQTSEQVPPVVIRNNLVVAKGPNFCHEDGRKPCASDSECTNGCGKPAVHGISATWISGDRAPKVNISDNWILVTDKHNGIGCFGCVGPEIVNNTISFAESATAWSGLFTGIQVINSVAKPGGKIVVSGNKIIGSGRPNDGRGILVADNNPGGSRVSVTNNSILDKHITPLLAAVEVRGVSQFQVSENLIQGVSGTHGLVIGSCQTQSTTDGIIQKNKIIMPDIADTKWSSVVFRKTANMLYHENVLFPTLPLLEQCPVTPMPALPITNR